MLDTQPEDILRYICTFLNYNDVLRLKLISKRFESVNRYIKHMCCIFNYSMSTFSDSVYEFIRNSNLDTFSIALCKCYKNDNSKKVNHNCEDCYHNEIFLEDFIDISIMIKCLPTSLKVLKLHDFVIDYKPIYDNIVNKLNELQNLKLFKMSGYIDKLEANKKEFIRVLTEHPSIEKYDIDELEEYVDTF
jgi:hypothetical protein